MSAATDSEGTQPTYRTPGLYRLEEDVFPPQTVTSQETGVPAFLGYVQRKQGPATAIKCPLLSHWEDFDRWYEDMPQTKSYLSAAVKGFFQNDGRHCYVVPLRRTDEPEEALAEGLERVNHLAAADLVCAPDIMASSSKDEKPDLERVRAMQRAVLAHCDLGGDRFAILDSPPRMTPEQVLDQRRGLVSMNGAFYYPWLRPAQERQTTHDYVPPCGHIAGIYARTDARSGVHKAPANEVVLGIVDLELNVTTAQQGSLNEMGVNCVRDIPGRGMRVWGARTLSGLPDWVYVNVRRLFIAAARWIYRNLGDVSFEPMTESLWTRIERDLTVYFIDLFQKGALQGDSPQEAFYVKCDRETNPPQHRDVGIVVTEIGLAPRVPSEFVVVRITHMASGVTLAGQSELGSA